MAFRLPDTSDLPSTPNTRSLRSQPSTTPAGPPPSYLTNRTTTPGIPPPKSVFGSSFNPSNATFPRQPGTSLKAFTVPESSPPRAFDDDTHAGIDDDAGDMYGMEQPRPSMYNSFAAKGPLMSSVSASPRGLKRSRNGKVQQRPESNIPAIARGFTSKSKIASLQEPDSLILRTEEIISKLDGDAQGLRLEEPEEAIAEAVSRLTTCWREQYPPSTREGGIGPSSEENAAKASYLASFLFQLHYPHTAHADHSIPVARQARSRSLTKPNQTHGVSVPRALLAWINAYHNPFPDEFNTIHLHQPSPSSHDAFWDVIYSSILRGKIDRAIRLLKDAGWENAVTALDDGADSPGYTGRQLDNTRAIVERCTTILQSCPAVRYDDWDVKNHDWAAFRQRVRLAVGELERFAEGGKEDVDSQRENVFARSAQSAMSLSTASRKAESRVPWTIYENLKVVYGQLLGSVDEILLVSQDWLEASVFLTVWWDGETEAATDLSRSTTRKRNPSSQRTREVDIAPLAAYRKRLHDAYALVTDKPEDPVFSVDTMDAVQIGLASIMEDNVDSVLRTLRILSIPIAAAVADIAALGAWLPQTRLRTTGLREQGFSEEDLMVLSHGPASANPSTDGLDRDDIILQYADLLADKNTLRSSDGSTEREGWELAASVLGRLDNAELGQEKIANLLDQIPLEDEARVNKVLALCTGLGLVDQARGIAERYADVLADTTRNYGAVLVFYARAHASEKLKDTLAFLTSLCLVQSAAMPPRSQTDEHLTNLLSVERSGLFKLARADPTASTLLAGHLSGYATARKFYELRDQEAHSSTAKTSKLRPWERKREAAKALVAVIESASDCIRGGLFDPKIESVIPVNGVLVLLGEALPLLNQQKRVFNKQQIYTLLRIIEDFAACPSSTREASSDLLKICAEASSGFGTRSETLKKSRSDISNNSSGLGGSSYDMLATSSSMLSEGSQGSSVQRAWDWRVGLRGLGSADVNAQSVLTVLRVALAQELDKGWSESSDW